MEQMSGTQGEGDSSIVDKKLQDEKGSSGSADDTESKEQRQNVKESSESSKNTESKEESEEGPQDSNSTTLTKQSPEETKDKSGEGPLDSNSTTLTKQSPEETKDKSEKGSRGSADDTESEEERQGVKESSESSKNTESKEESGNGSEVANTHTPTEQSPEEIKNDSGEGSHESKSTISTEQSSEETKDKSVNGSEVSNTATSTEQLLEEKKNNSGEGSMDSNSTTLPEQSPEETKNNSGEGSEVSNTATSTGQIPEEKMNIRGNDLGDRTENTSVTGERYSLLDVVKPMKTEETANTSRKFQSRNDDFLKKDEGTMETASRHERASNQCSGRNIFKEGEDTAPTSTKDKSKHDIELEQLHEEKHPQPCKRPDNNGDTHRKHETAKENHDEVLRKLESTSKAYQDLLRKTEQVKQEKEDKTKACKELVEKDIESQQKMFTLKTDLLDMKNRYKDMEKQKSSVEKYLKEEQKSWAKEKTKMQKNHEDESKKHSQEIEKANKRIGSLNKKIADNDEELRSKRQLIDKLGREKKEVDKQNTDHEKYKLNLHDYIQKMKNQKIQDESEHKKKIKELDREINAERDNFNRLSYQYSELVTQIQALQGEKRALTEEKQDLLLRLSKVAGANLTYNNPNIADLSDEKRPTKLAEEFSELYDNEWTDAFEDLTLESEKEKTAFMLKLIKRASRLCSDVSSGHVQNIKDSLCTLVLPSKPSKCSKESIDKNNIQGTIASSEDTSSNISKVNDGEGKKHTDIEGMESSDDPNKPSLAKESNENAQDEKETAANTNQHPVETDGEGTKPTHIKGMESAVDPNKPSLANENNENAQEKKEITADNTNQPPVVNDGEDKKHKDTERTEFSDDLNKPSLANENNENAQEKKEITADNTNQPPVVKDGEGTKHTDTERTEFSDDPNKPSRQADCVRVENKERQENQDETFGIATSKDTWGDVHINDEEEENSCSSKQRDMVRSKENVDDSPEEKGKTATAVKEIVKEEIQKKQKNVVNSTGNVDDTQDTKKQGDIARSNENVDDSPEERETDANAEKEIWTEQIEEIRLEVDFDELLQKEQKKTIMDAKKLVEKHLSEEIEAAGTDLIIKEHGIDPQKQESVVEFIKKCLNICWSMNRNEPPVFVDFPDISENVKFDTNMFKPYTKAGNYIDYVVWPAIYLHEEGPLLCKGVAQGRKE